MFDHKPLVTRCQPYFLRSHHRVFPPLTLCCTISSATSQLVWFFGQRSISPLFDFKFYLCLELWFKSYFTFLMEGRLPTPNL